MRTTERAPRCSTVAAALLLCTLLPWHVVTSHAQTQTGGVELDAYGDLTTFGHNTIDTSGAAHWTSDIARSVALQPDGSGGWTLDGHGGVHPFGAAPALTGTPSWGGWDIARALVVLPGTTEGYVLDGFGGLHPFGGAPVLQGAPYWPGADVARGLDIHVDASGVPDGGATLDETGAVHPFGVYPYTLRSVTSYPGRSAYLALHDTGGVVYAVGHYGAVVEETAGESLTPDYAGFKDYGEQDAIRDIALLSPSGGTGPAPPLSVMAQRGWAAVIGPRGGVTLDGYGGLHPFGGLHLDTAGSAYWPGWDMARGLAVLPDASGGWTLDGWGGLHAFGAAPALSGYPYWPGWNIARALVVDPDGRSGYVLDGWGGLHPFGGAPALSGYPYWPGSDRARGLTIDYSNSGTPIGGWTLDADGVVHAFGAAPAVAEPQAWPGRDLFEQLNSTYGGTLYTVARFGLVSPLAGSVFHPYWTGYADWGGWDIVRDTVLFGADGGTATSQPVSSAASTAYWDRVWTFSFNLSPVAQGLPLDCESAALEEATIAKGRDISQYSIFEDLPKQPGSAQWGPYGITRWGDPYAAFVGDVYGSESRGTGYGVYDPAIVQVARYFGFNAVGLEGASANTVFTYLAMGDPVVVVTSDTYTPVATRWWTAWDGRSIPYSLTDHAVTLVAENGVAGTVTLNDVADGRMKTFTMKQFASFWTAYLDMAVVLT